MCTAGLPNSQSLLKPKATGKTLLNLLLINPFKRGLGEALKLKKMKKKFAHLGRVLSREEAKLIVGGTAPVDEGSDASGCGSGCSGKCITNDTKQNGTCNANSAGKCFCVAVY